MYCGHDLAAIDLIPVVSYLLTKGKCRYCKEKISPRYPLTELSFGIITLSMYLAVLEPSLRLSFTVDVSTLVLFFRNLVLSGILFIIALTDLETFEIPDGCILAGIITWVVTAPFMSGEGLFSKTSLLWMGNHILAGILMLVIMLLLTMAVEKFLKKEALGGGDIKLFAMLALYLGYAGSYELIIFSCISGLVFAALRRLLYPDASKAFPFGPAIAFSGYLLLIFSESITSWYLGLLM
jgi:leader peptidase (prepilin peptidase)/N-methyltransferase